MPELHFALRWPDGSTETYYSPSTSIREHLAAPASYPLPELLTRVRAAMHHASERVRAKYGFSCSSAAATLAQIEATAAVYADRPAAEVEVLRLG
ncbi:MAG: MSMEG_0570 family nitrogen starvation response protein [Polyangiales bacterium]